MKKSSKVFVGMDVHKESIEVTLAEEGGELRRLGQIGGDRASLLKMVRRQQSKGGERVFVYEAGPWCSRDQGSARGSAAWWSPPRWYPSARAIM